MGLPTIISNLLFCGIFIMAAVNHTVLFCYCLINHMLCKITNFNLIQLNFEDELPKLEQVGIPKELAPMCFGIAIGLMIIGSILIMLQYLEIIGYMCYIGFLIPVTYFMHIVPIITAKYSSSKESSAQVIQLHIIQTLKNISLIGACFKFIINEAEKASEYVESQKKNNKKQSKKRR